MPILTCFSAEGITWSSALPFRVGSSFTASSMMLRACWISSSVITNGGARRMMFW